MRFSLLSLYTAVLLFEGMTHFLGADEVPQVKHKESIETAAGEKLSTEEAFERGRALAGNGELRDALPFLRVAGDQGHVDGQYLCALALIRLEAPASYAEAALRLENAAEMGSIPALEEQARLALEGGLGKEPDYEEAKVLLERAIRSPAATESFYLLGKMMAEGLGRERDPATAVSFLRRGEAAGSASSMVALADLYAGAGGLVEQDLPQAKALLERAFLQKSSEAAYRLGRLEELQGGSEFDRDDAREWFVKASELGNASAFKKLGDYALTDPEEDSSKAFGYYQAAAALQSAEASYALAALYREGRTVSEDLVAAAAWMRIAADRGHPFAQNELGVMLLNGSGVASNLEDAIRQFEQAAEKKLPAAQYNLGFLLLKLDPDESRQKRALSLLEAAASNEHADAAVALHKIYQEGDLVKKDSVAAAYWAHRASTDKRHRQLAEESLNGLSTEERAELTRRLDQP